MKKLILITNQISLLIFINTVNGQDTLLLHYEKATISEVILDESENGTITGKGEDLSIGKYMYFNSGLHKSPEAILVSALMDLEVSNFSDLDSFSVFVQQKYGSSFEDRYEEKFSFAEVLEESIVIRNNEVAAYNFKVDLLESEVFNIGSVSFNVGIRYNNNSDAKIALRATGTTEFPEAESRSFTINEDGSISDFVSTYNAEAGLAIFPITFISGTTQETSELGLEILRNGDDVIRIKSNDLSQNYTLSIIGLSGQVLDRKQMNSGGIIEFNTSLLPRGVYIINAINKLSSASSKVFIP